MLARFVARFVLVALCAAPVYADQWDEVQRVLAIGDVHGAHGAVVDILQAAGVIDDNLAWSGGATHLVSVGDLIDRGEGSRAVLDLFMRLQQEARAAGGRVHVLVGNHEIMNLTGELRDVSAEEMASYGGPEGHATLFAADGVYGSWLLTLPVTIRINDTVFAHAGFSERLRGWSIPQINETFAAELKQLLAARAVRAVQKVEGGIPEAADEAEPAPPPHFLFDVYGPVWYRGNARCHSVLEEPRITRLLDELSVLRIVQGHTPTPTRTVTTRFDDRVVMIDTGMLTSVYRGHAFVLELVPGQAVQVIDKTGAKLPLGDNQPEPELEFAAMGERQARREVAAHRLDALLGLGFTAPTQLAEQDGEPGVQRVVTRTFSERTRLERGINRTNECESGNDFDLLAAFDSLAGMDSRDVDNLTYTVPVLAIRAEGYGDAFPTSTRPGVYNYQPSLAPELRRRLVSLNEEVLTTRLGDLLSKRQIRAILKRRDRILEWPGLAAPG